MEVYWSTRDKKIPDCTYIKQVDGVLIVCRTEDPEERDIIQVAAAFGTLDSFCLLEDDEVVDTWHLSLGEESIFYLKGFVYWVCD